MRPGPSAGRRACSDAPGDADVSTILGLDREADFEALHPADREHPDALVLVGPPEGIDESRERTETDLDLLLALAREGEWTGRPNPLSPAHVEWPAIADVASRDREATDAASPGPQPVIPRDFDGRVPRDPPSGRGRRSQPSDWSDSGAARWTWTA